MRLRVGSRRSWGREKSGQCYRAGGVETEGTHSAGSWQRFREAMIAGTRLVASDNLTTSPASLFFLPPMILLAYSERVAASAAYRPARWHRKTLGIQHPFSGLEPAAA